jgi:hypothetical protein
MVVRGAACMGQHTDAGPCRIAMTRRFRSLVLISRVVVSLRRVEGLTFFFGNLAAYPFKLTSYYVKD